MSEYSFLSPVDSLYSFYPRSEFWQYFLSLDSNSYMMGGFDSNWAFVFKDLPLYILNLVTPSMGVSITVYLIVINLIGFRIIHITLQAICKDLQIIRLTLAILWILGPQFQAWSWSAPNVQLYYAFFPLPLFYLVKYMKENNDSKFHLAVLSSISIGIFDPSYGVIGIIAYNAIFIFVLFSNSASLLYLYLKSVALGIFIIIFNYSGIISPLILGSFSTSSMGAIAEIRDSEIIKSTIESATIASTLFGHFGNVKFNNLGINLPPILFYWQVILFTIIALLLVSNRKYRVFAPVFIFSLIMVSGKNLPYFTSFYQFVFGIPGTVLFRNIFKWNIVVYFIFLISCLYIIKYWVVEKKQFRKRESKVKIIALCFVFLFPILFTSSLYLNSISQIGHLSHIVIPNEYLQLSQYLNQRAKGFRVYYLPINNWTVPERYVWSKVPQRAPINPFIGSLIEAPNNLRPTFTQHELTIGLKNLVYVDKILLDDKLIFFESLGFKYIILRSDRLEEPLDEIAKDEFRLWTKYLSNSRANIVFRNKTFSVFEIKAVPIVRTTPTIDIKYLFNSQNIVLGNRQSYSIIKIYNSQINSAHNILLIPIIESKLGNYLFIKSPIIFGRTDSSNLGVCENEKIENSLKKLTILQNIGTQEIGNCYEISSKSHNFVIIPASDLLSLYLKISMGFLIILILVRFVIQSYRLNEVDLKIDDK